MVGDVSPDIHFKNFRASGSGPTACADPHRDWPGLADKIKPSIRQAAAIALVAVGALAAAPWLVKITLGQINRPESEWGSRARLRSIRGDSGYSADTDIY